MPLTFRAILIAVAALLAGCPPGEDPRPRERGTLSFESANFQVLENAGPALIPVLRTDGEAGAARVRYEVTAITATPGSDFALASGELSWGRGESGTRTIEVTIYNDGLYEGIETVGLALSGAKGAVLGELDTATLTIEDDDPPTTGSLSFAAASYAVSESGSRVLVTVTRSDGSQLPATVDYSASSGTAGVEDFTAVSGRFEWADGDDTSRAFEVPILDDTRHEGPETINLALTNATGATLGSRAATTITINDDDPAPTLAFSSNQYTASENEHSITVTVLRSGDGSGAASVDYATASNTAIEGADFTAASGTLQWPAGDMASRSFSVMIIDDDHDEPREVAQLALSNPVGAVLGVPSNATLNINDNDAPPPPPPSPGTLSLANASRTVQESAGTVVFSVLRTGGEAGAASVDYSIAGDSATLDEDFTGASGTLNWADGDSSPKTFSITIVDDDVDETAETALITLSDASGAGLGSPAGSTLTITDNDNPDAGTFTLSGVVSVPADSHVDSDVNDSLTTPVSNNTVGTAQVLPNTVTLGGYANEAGTGEPGNSFDSGDPIDVYCIELLAGQNVNMYVADAPSDDLDLFLYESCAAPSIHPDDAHDASFSTGSGETVTASIQGPHLVVVRVWSGASNYVLQTSPQTTAVAEDSGTQFVPGQVIVSYREGVVAKSGTDALLDMGLTRRGGGSGRAALYELPTPGLPEGISPGTSAKAGTGLTRKSSTVQAIKELRNRADVEYAEPNYIRRPLLVPNDPSYGAQWHYPLINLPAAWDITTGDASVVVGVVDTGVVLAHPDLNDNLVAGYDFISNATRALDGDGIDNDPDDPGDQEGLGSSFHGTHVAGTVSAETNNGIGVAGVGWQTSIMPLRVLGRNGFGTSYDIQQAVRYAAGLSNDSGTVPPTQAAVINLSLGGSGFSNSEQQTFTDARDAGSIIVSSAGNDGDSSFGYPASYAGVVSVASVGPDLERAYYSQFNSAVDVAAPGGDQSTGSTDGVMSTHASDSAGSIVTNYSFLQGTSMASPHIAGVIALMKAVHPAMSPQDFDDLLAAGTITDDLGPVGRDNEFGHGLINARKAVAAALELAGGGEPPVNPVLGSSTSSLNFGTFLTSRNFDLSNIGTGTLNVNDVTANQPWITVTAINTSSNGLGRYRVEVDRSALADGLYQGNIAVDSDANDLDISVTVQVGSGGEGSAGRLYLRLLDPNDFEILGELNLEPVGGEYPYVFEDIGPGTYVIYATTDNDKDFLNCDEGEACGAYSTLADVVEIEVIDSDIPGLDFLAGFELSIGTATNAGASESRQAHRPALPATERER